jgi:hypothetical protein
MLMVEAFQMVDLIFEEVQSFGAAFESLLAFEALSYVDLARNFTSYTKERSQRRLMQAMAQAEWIPNQPDKFRAQKQLGFDRFTELN